MKNYEILNKNMVIAEFIDNELIIKNERLTPFFLNRTKDFLGWLESRAIDKHRTNSRLLKKALRLTNEEDFSVVLSVNALTITDNYWVREVGSELQYEDVNFKKNIFDKLALNGDPDSFNLQAEMTPELTNIGSFEKCWRLENGRWVLIKKGTPNEIFSEYFIYLLGKKLGYNMAEYKPFGEDYISSLDFTNGVEVNFESMYGLVGDNEDYKLNYETLPENCREDYLKMLFLDTLCFNMDRHTKNYGVLRDVLTGEVLGFAPNFDNNIALISRGYPKDISRINDKLISLWNEFDKDFTYPQIDEPMILECIEETKMEVDTDFICEFLLNGLERILARR